MASVAHSRWNTAAGVPIFYPLVRHTGQQRGIISRPSSTHQGETEPARPSSPEAASHKEGGLLALDCARPASILPYRSSPGAGG